MTRDVKASPVLMALIREIEKDYRRRVSEAVEMGATEAGLPATANLNISRGVWDVPTEEP